MKFNTDGLVIREQSIKEQDKLITVLTRSDGLIRAFIH
ncbi:MAG: recombination protein O N-terminal domain-containing protein, partial [Clostridia bacterium]|nr:recombination protein O N-terminal domain-containing protein [Clostridia bacterium]